MPINSLKGFGNAQIVRLLLLVNRRAYIFYIFDVFLSIGENPYSSRGKPPDAWGFSLYRERYFCGIKELRDVFSRNMGMN